MSADRKANAAKEQQVLDRYAQKARMAGANPRLIEDALYDLTDDLPPGKAKEFFREIDEIQEDLTEIAKAMDVERIPEALVMLRTLREKLRGTPEGIPKDIVDAYDYLFRAGEALLLLMQRCGG